jgi:hypothetical protein
LQVVVARVQLQQQVLVVVELLAVLVVVVEQVIFQEQVLQIIGEYLEEHLLTA